MKVRNMVSSSGRKVANQFIIDGDEYTYFQSYETMIAKIHKDTGFVTLDSAYWDYSRTTGKYRNQFLDENIDETRKKIASGTYLLANLNRGV